MSRTLILVALLAVFALALYHFRLSPAYNGTKHTLPNAHPTSAFSAQWFKHQIRKSRHLETLLAVHTRFGPIVRLGPNEISIVSEEGLRKVYVAGLDKSEWYRQTFCNFGVQNLVCTLDHGTHSQVRKMIAPLYTKSYLQRSTDLDMLSRKIIFQRLIPTLNTYARTQQEVDVVQLFEWTGVDFISAFLFGNAVSTDFLGDGPSRESYFGEWDRLRKSPDLKDMPVTENLFMRMCEVALSTSQVEGTRPLVMAKIWAEMCTKAEEWGFSDDDIMKRSASEMLDHVIATQETQTTAWTYILYHLSLNPQLQEELRSELVKLRPSLGSGAVDERLPKPSDIDKLPLLNAVVQETLRLHAPNPGRMQRVVPKNGLILHGFSLSPGTIVSTNAYCLHRKTEVFPDPFVWKPERWLPNVGIRDLEKPESDPKQRWFWAFGSGPRMCIGQHFAVQVLKLVVALIYTHYTTSVVDDRGIEQSDSYNSGPVSHQLMLRFHSAQEAELK